jgi:hypothetical protein
MTNKYFKLYFGVCAQHLYSVESKFQFRNKKMAQMLNNALFDNERSNRSLNEGSIHKRAYIHLT